MPNSPEWEPVRAYVRWLSALDEERSREWARIPDQLRQNDPQSYYMRCLADTSAFHERFVREQPSCPPLCARLRNYYDEGLSALEIANRIALGEVRALASTGQMPESNKAFGRARDLLKEAGNDMQALCSRSGIPDLRIHY
jgi:hypothetical protein